jgi:hypothetical protein
MLLALDRTESDTVRRLRSLDAPTTAIGVFDVLSDATPDRDRLLCGRVNFGDGWSGQSSILKSHSAVVRFNPDKQLAFAG